MLLRKQKDTSYLSDPDVELMLEFKAGRRDAIEELMGKYYPRILNFIYRFLGNRQLAEDLTQEVFVRVYQSAPRYRPRSRFQTWLYTIAKNACLNELRRKKGFMLSFDGTLNVNGGELKREISDPVADPARQFIQKETVALIRAAIDDLPENQRMALILRRYDNFSYVEIAATLNVTAKAVKSLLSRAKVNLKNKLTGI